MKKFSLLTPGLLLLFLFSSGIIVSQEPVQIDKELASKFSLLVNREEVCEAYPYLSGDGLRLYFTTDREGGHGRLYFCSRNSVKENFNAPKPLSQNLPDGYYAATLTADELSIYVSHEDEIYVAKRKSINDEFDEPVMIKGLVEGHKYAPAISQDGNELIVIFDDDNENNDVAIHYRKNSLGKFIEVNRMVADQTVDLDPGQFSKDGLSFYTSYEIKNTISEPDFKTEESGRDFTQKIIRFTRQSLDDIFKEIEEMPDLSTSMRNHQPTMNEDETIFIVTTSAKDLWSENELRLMNFDKIIIVEECKCEEEEIPEFLELKFPDSAFILLSGLEYKCDPIEFCGTGFIYIIPDFLPETMPVIKVYPNPFIDNISINLGKTDLSYSFDLYDISGRKVLTSKLNNISNNIRFNQPGSGVYIYKLTDKTGKLITSGKLVKK